MPRPARSNALEHDPDDAVGPRVRGHAVRDVLLRHKQSTVQPRFESRAVLARQDVIVYGLYSLRCLTEVSHYTRQVAEACHDICLTIADEHFRRSVQR